MRDVFLCHAHSDSTVAAKICDFLEGEKISCWMMERDLASGEDAVAMSNVAVDACPVMVFIFSSEANASAQIHDQVERALQAEKILIPLRIENVAPTGRMEAALRHRFRHDAFVGPLERHLPELVRMLKPLLHRLVVKTREATSISRTLPSRSSIVRGGEGRTESSGNSTGPLELAFHFPHPVFAGHPSSVEVKVRVCDPALMGEGRLTIEGLGLKRRVTLELGDFGGNSDQRHTIAFEPARSGIFPLHVTLALDDQNRRLQLSGSRSLRINQARAMSDVVRPEEVMVNHAKEDLFLAPGRPGEGGAPVSGLLAVEVPENFETLELNRDFEVDRRAIESLKLPDPLRIEPGFETKGQPGTLLRLEPEEVSPELPYQEIRLVARASFTVGRQREESDYLAWFWPRNDIHDTKTRRISKKHGTFVREGSMIAIRNVAAGSLTTFDGQDLVGSEVMVLDGIGTLSLSGIYDIAVARFPSTLDAGTPAPHAETPRGSVSFTSRTANTLPQHAIWLLSDGSFGSNAANPLQIAIPGLADIQGRFHYDHGMFWLESVFDNRAVELEGTTLARGVVAPLGPGMKIRLGDQMFRVIVEA